MLRDSGRVRYEAVTDDDALRAFRELARLEGIIPALEPAHAIAWLLANQTPVATEELRRPDLSGRGDKDLAEVVERSRRWLTRIAAGVRGARRAGRARRADAVPDGRLPRSRDLRRGRRGLRRRGRRPDRARRPVLGSARRRPGDPRGRDPRAGRRRDARHPCSPTASGSPSGVPVVPMAYANMVLRPRAAAVRPRARRRRRAPGRSSPTCRSRRAARSPPSCAPRGLALIPLVAPTTPPERRARICAEAGASSTSSPTPGRPASASELPAALGELVAGDQGRRRGPGRGRVRDRHPRAGGRGRGGRRRRDHRHPARARGRRGRRRARGRRAVRRVHRRRHAAAMSR